MKVLPVYSRISLFQDCSTCINHEWCGNHFLVVLDIYRADEGYKRVSPCYVKEFNDRMIVLGICYSDCLDRFPSVLFEGGTGCWICPPHNINRPDPFSLFPGLKQLHMKRLLDKITREGCYVPSRL